MARKTIAAVVAATIATLTVCPMSVQAAVYVEDTSGNVSEYDTMPTLPMQDVHHVEYVDGIADGDGMGHVVYSSDGDYRPLNYSPIPTYKGEKVRTIAAYSVDGIQLRRVDITPDN